MTQRNNGNGHNGHNGNGRGNRYNGNLTPLQVVEEQERFLGNIEAEEDTLACLMQSPFAIQRVVDDLEPDHFYRDAHRTIYQVMKYLYEHDRRCNAVNVADELRRRNKLEEIGGIETLNHLQFSVAPLQRGGIEDPARAVIDKAIYRNLRNAAQECYDLANREEEGAVDRAMEIMSRVALGSHADAVEPFSGVVDSAMGRLRQRRRDAANGLARGLSTGYPELDRMYGGLQPGHLIVVGALTGYGKSAWALNVGLNIALADTESGRKNVYIASLEMSQEEIVERALAVRALVDHGLIRDGTLSDEEMQRVEEAAQSLAECQIWLDDSSYTVQALSRQVKQRHARQRLDLIVVDYLQLLESSNEKKGTTRAQDVEEISRQLKRLAHELDVPVLALAQINRNRKDGEEPTLADINESGGIARNSNLVLFIYVDDEEQLARRENAQTFQMTFKVAKARSGRMGKINLVYIPRITKFVENTVENAYSSEENENDAQENE